ncbi:Sulfotransferase domain-containing protein [Thermodesulfobium acidiphilum]|uniref:Sulfotransferase domain-containing protein n=1 Tax=Thermodesulfobium acidiphilum TaxID=1794699 RepID=A0A2R4W0Q8_THEAF|nr:Sulfotransferase domain-containing protein [Thermodesulfobium acidiphilum]
MYHYLSKHPQVFMSKIKEPKFFSYISGHKNFNGPGDSEGERDIIKTFEDYRRLFLNVNGSKVLGECSVDSLYYYESVIPKIKEYLDEEVKIFIILRNPIDRAYSSYIYHLRDGRENLSFEEALTEEEKRIKDNWEFMWHYKSVGLYSNQVKAYLDNFKNVKVCLFEDLKENPDYLIKELFNFLGVDPEFVPGDLEIEYNKSGIPRFKSLYNFLNKPNFFKFIVKNFFPKNFRIKLKNKFMNKLLIKPDEINKDTREYLINFYKEDIVRLQKLIDRDLSSWLK